MRNHFPPRKTGRPRKENPRRKREVWMTDEEWAKLKARSIQFSMQPGETIGLLAELS